MKEVQQGLRKDGTPVLPDRSDPTDALGVAENDPNTPGHNIDGTYFSLGFGGKLVLGFDNPICNAPGADFDVGLVEATGEPYPIETVKVYVSKTGYSWVFAGTVSRDGSVSLPASVAVAKYVKLVDVSNPAEFPDDADGYDVDGVRSLNDDLKCKGKMVGVGKVWLSKYKHAAYAFLLRCDGKTPVLKVLWEKHSFVLTSLQSVACTDDPAIDENPPRAGFDTVTGVANGKLDGKSGATAEFEFTDTGGFHSDDTAHLLIRDKYGNVKLDLPKTVVYGVHEALLFDY